MMRVRRNIVSVSDCSTVTSGARFRSGSVASAIPNSSANTATCRIWFCATASAMFSGKMLSTICCHPSGCAAGTAACTCGGQRDANSGLREVHGDQADDQAERGDNFKVDDRLDRHPPHAAQFAMAGDAGHDAAEDQRRHDHANEAQEDFSDDVSLRGNVRHIGAEFRAGQHRKEGPHEQRTAPQRHRDEHADRNPAQPDRDTRRRREGRPQPGRPGRGPPK